MVILGDLGADGGQGVTIGIILCGQINDTHSSLKQTDLI